MKMFAEGKQKIHSWWWQGPGWCWGGKWHLSSWVPDWTEWNYSKVHEADNLVDIPLGQVSPCSPPGLLAHQLNFPLGCSDHTSRWNNCLHRLFFHRRGKLPREGIWRLNIPGTPGSRGGWNWSMAGTDLSVKLMIRMQEGEVLVICPDDEWVSSPLRQLSPLLQTSTTAHIIIFLSLREMARKKRYMGKVLVWRGTLGKNGSHSAPPHFGGRDLDGRKQAQKKISFKCLKAGSAAGGQSNSYRG